MTLQGWSPAIERLESAIGTLGKLVGCAGIGMLLNVKGYLYIYCTLAAAFEAARVHRSRTCRSKLQHHDQAIDLKG
jgi:hypothetical protein